MLQVSECIISALDKTESGKKNCHSKTQRRSLGHGAPIGCLWRSHRRRARAGPSAPATASPARAEDEATSRGRRWRPRPAMRRPAMTPPLFRSLVACLRKSSRAPRQSRNTGASVKLRHAVTEGAGRSAEQGGRDKSGRGTRGRLRRRSPLRTRGFSPHHGNTAPLPRRAGRVRRRPRPTRGGR